MKKRTEIKKKMIKKLLNLFKLENYQLLQYFEILLRLEMEKLHIVI